MRYEAEEQLYRIRVMDKDQAHRTQHDPGRAWKTCRPEADGSL